MTDLLQEGGGVMSDAPERIWVASNEGREEWWLAQLGSSVLIDQVDDSSEDTTAYVRADLFEALQAERDRLREALDDLVSWIPEKPSKPQWQFEAGEYGADDAIAAAREALKEPTP